MAVGNRKRGFGGKGKAALRAELHALAPGGIETPMVMGISGRGGTTPMEIPEGPLAMDALAVAVAAAVVVC